MNLSLTDCLSTLQDPRVPRSRVHPLINILVIGVCSILCCGEGWEDMAEFAEAKHDWLAQRLDMRSGVPCADTFRRVFARLDPEAFAAVFLEWVSALRLATPKDAEGRQLCVDGKQLRHSFDTATEQSAVHMVSVFAASDRLVLAQSKVDEKTNEIPAVPALLALLDLNGCLVTADALHCQKATVRRIREQNADYILAVKDNQPHLAQDLALLFEGAADPRLADTPVKRVTAHDAGHGRFDTRTCEQIDLDALEGRWSDLQALWPGLRTAARITSTRRTAAKTTTEVRTFISSLPPDAAKLLRAVRRHWSIENSLHWVLDVVFAEDACRVRKDHGAQNLAVLRHIALNLLRREQGHKRGMKARRKRAAWDDKYLSELLTI